ncbi:MAG: hypothetical protein ACKO3W_06655 [bacterium]
MAATADGGVIGEAMVVIDPDVDSAPWASPLATSAAATPSSERAARERGDAGGNGSARERAMPR